MNRPIKLYKGLGPMLDGIAEDTSRYVDAVGLAPDVCQMYCSRGYDPTGVHAEECRTKTDLFCIEDECYVCACCALECGCVEAKHRIVEVKGHA